MLKILCMKIFLLSVFCVFLFLTSSAQNNTLKNTIQNAFLVYRMAEKLHVNPKPLNENFSDQLFTLLLKKIDPQKKYFLQTEIAQLQNYRYQLHTQIIQKKTDFLQLLTTYYQQHLQQLDTLTENICKQPFNLNISEKITVAEDSSFPLNLQQQKTKWYKNFKLSTLYTLASLQDTIKKIPTTKQKFFIDSLENIIRKKTASYVKRNFKLKLQSPGGVEQLVGNIFCKALANCYDPHSSFMSLTDRENFETDLGRSIPSFGFSLTTNENDNVVIDDLTPGSNAFKSGLLNKGDKIISIQWESEKPIDVSDASIEEIERILNISNHAKATLTVIKADGTKRSISLLKEIQKQEDGDDDEMVKSFILKGEKTIGYISLPSFYIDWEDENSVNGCANDVAKEIVKLKKENIEGLIIDVRYNGGGSVREAVDLAGIFIDAGPLSIYKNREPKPTTLKDANRGTIYDAPLLIMVNGYSASASELFAGAMQDYNRAVIVGSNTYGKATGQVILPLDTTAQHNKDYKNSKADYFLKLTVSQIFRVTGKTAQFTGIVPDIILPDATDAAVKEKDEFCALPATNMEANKYYQPLTAINIEALKQTATQELNNNSTYFNKLKNIIGLKKEWKQKKVDFPLNYTEFIKFYNQIKNVDDEDDEDDNNGIDNTNTTTKLFTIENTSMEKQLQKTNEYLTEVNNLYKQHLLRDAQLQICYALIKKMVK